MQYGRLTVLRKVAPVKHNTMVECRCNCGTTKVFRLSNLKAGLTQSCGCIQKEHPNATRHGYHGTRVYSCWLHMLQRCTNPNDKDYLSYGGRGITVCERWLIFVNFLKDMGEPPFNRSLDRIDNDGNYEPSNCEWADAYTQANNRR